MPSGAGTIPNTKETDAIARVIIAAGKWTPPALVALCEVENDSVLRDLTRYSVLREAGYRYVITHSPDNGASMWRCSIKEASSNYFRTEAIR